MLGRARHRSMRRGGPEHVRRRPVFRGWMPSEHRSAHPGRSPALAEHTTGLPMPAPRTPPPPRSRRRAGRIPSRSAHSDPVSPVGPTEPVTAIDVCIMGSAKPSRRYRRADSPLAAAAESGKGRRSIISPCCLAAAAATAVLTALIVVGLTGFVLVTDGFGLALLLPTPLAPR